MHQASHCKNYTILWISFLNVRGPIGPLAHLHKAIHEGHAILYSSSKLLGMEDQDDRYTTLSEAVEDLKRRGYTDELTLTDDGLFNSAEPLDPAQFTIDSFHRFEGPSDPADMSIVYAVSSEAKGLRGLLVGEYGANAQDFIHVMVQLLPAHAHEGLVQPVQAITMDLHAKH